MKDTHKNKGFTLVEILVAMLIATTLLLAVIRIFARVGETFDQNAEALQLMETTRVALRFVKSDLIQAGYMGCMQTDDNDYLDKFIEPMINNVQISNYGVWGAEGGGNPDGLTLFYMQDLDIRVLATDINGQFVPNPSLVVDSVNVFDDAGDLTILPGDWLVVNNCIRATAFILTNTPNRIDAAGIGMGDAGSTAEGDVSPLEFEVGVSFNGYRNVTDSPMRTNNGYGYLAGRGGASTVGKYYQVEYEVADSLIDSGATQSLYRLVNGEARSKTNEVVRLVEDFQVDYGVDDDSDGVVDRYINGLTGNDDKPVVIRVTIKINDGNRTEELVNIVKLRNKGM